MIHKKEKEHASQWQLTQLHSQYTLYTQSQIFHNKMCMASNTITWQNKLKILAVTVSKKIEVL